jgi:hypothetical protein
MPFFLKDSIKVKDEERKMKNLSTLSCTMTCTWLSYLYHNSVKKSKQLSPTAATIPLLLKCLSSFQPKSCKERFLGLVAKKNKTDSIEHNALARGPNQHLSPLAYTVESNSPAIRQIAEQCSSKQLHYN